MQYAKRGKSTKMRLLAKPAIFESNSMYINLLKIAVPHCTVYTIC